MAKKRPQRMYNHDSSFLGTLEDIKMGRRFAFCFVLLTALVISSPAQTFTSLFSFDGSHGAYPYVSVLQGVDGNFYGTASDGGKTDEGTFFTITPNGTLTTLYNFCVAPHCPDGRYPEFGFVMGGNGDFYGTTARGGGQASGTLFRISPHGKLTNLHRFCYGCLVDGQGPSGLMVAIDGSLYGTTQFGGANGDGSVFTITPAGAYSTIYNFCSQTNCTDGSAPFGPLVQAYNGDLYGTTSTGGNGSKSTGGTVFKITHAGNLTTLYHFCSQLDCVDGATPEDSVALASDGNFYGTTYSGGVSNKGTIFRMTPGGTLTTLYSFCSLPDCRDGDAPFAGLAQGTDGNFYGTTEFGGLYGDGTIFQINPKGVFTSLHSFDKTDGANPAVRLTQGTDGMFYGTTLNGGGTFDYGTVFSLSVGLGPFVKTVTGAGKVGASVTLLGTDLADTTSLSFNGVPAVFNVISPTAIIATVPAGAVTGPVQVVTPGGTLVSNLPFRIL